jgi:hypothetical protein
MTMSLSIRTLVALLGVGVLILPVLRADEPPRANTKLANAKARAEAARKVYEGLLGRAKVDQNGLDLDKLDLWSRRWMEADQEQSEKKEDRIATAEAHLQRAKKLEATIKQLFEQKGFVSRVELDAQTYFRLDAERTLAELKDK